MDTKNIRIELKEDIRAEKPAVGWLYDTLEQALDEIDRLNGALLTPHIDWDAWYKNAECDCHANKLTTKKGE